MQSLYHDATAVNMAVERGTHRDLVGGMWEEIGHLQFEFLKEQGLLPDHTLLDIGCGCLRGGVHFVRFLEPNHYFGIDLNESLLEAGYRIELANAGLTNKLHRNQLRAVNDFDVSSFGVAFNFAIALSLFTHLPVNSIRVCLERLASVMPPGGRFYATFFEIPDRIESWRPHRHLPGNVETYGDKDPYHYRAEDFLFAAAGLPWKVGYVGDFGHPRAQRMMSFTRL